MRQLNSVLMLLSTLTMANLSLASNRTADMQLNATEWMEPIT
jgi:hypothetical protein